MSELQRLREKWGAQSQQPGWQYEQYEERDRGSGSEGPSGSSAPREGSTSAWERDYHEAASSAHSLMVRMGRRSESIMCGVREYNS